MIQPDLLAILCCPETHQDLTIADSSLIATVNQAIKSGTIKSRAGKPVTAEIEGGLVRADRKFLYPIVNKIPVLLVEEAIPLNP